MIIWKDFVLDHEIGPFLIDQTISESCREERSGDPCIMEDAFRGQIQETGQEQSPARMVGAPGLDSHTYPYDKDVDGARLDTDSRLRRER